MNINFSHLSTAAISEATKSAFIFKESPFESTPIGEITGINLSEIKFNNNEGSTLTTSPTLPKSVFFIFYLRFNFFCLYERCILTS